MSKYEEADLILKLYDLRREETLRKARDWYVRDFHPQSLQDFMNTMFGEHSGYLRMVMTYWDMAAALVNHGAISGDLFNETNGEYIGVFSKIEPLLEQIRGSFGPQFLVNLEKLVDATPGGRDRVKATRERMAGIRAELMARQAKAD
jgi:hypothetical protein